MIKSSDLGMSAPLLVEIMGVEIKVALFKATSIETDNDGEYVYGDIIAHVEFQRGGAEFKADYIASGKYPVGLPQQAKIDSAGWFNIERNFKLCPGDDSDSLDMLLDSVAPSHEAMLDSVSAEPDVIFHA